MSDLANLDQQRESNPVKQRKKLDDVWDVLSGNPRLGMVAEVGRGLIYHDKQLPLGSRRYSKAAFLGGQAGFVLFETSLQIHQLPHRYWMNLSASVIQRPMSGTTVGTPQVLLNYASASRGPWRIKALIDHRGHPVTGRFMVVRPTSAAVSLETLWAILNSPVANAYAFSRLRMRANSVGDIRRIPFPRVTSFEDVDRAARVYLDAALSGAETARLRELLLQLDCEVLKLYSLHLSLENSLLSIFRRWERVGVPFHQREYLPEELSGRVRFSDFVEFERDWLSTNQERGELIDKNIAGTLSPDERIRLDALQAYADYHFTQAAPPSTGVLDELEKRMSAQTPMKDAAAEWTNLSRGDESHAPSLGLLWNHKYPLDTS